MKSKFYPFFFLAFLLASSCKKWLPENRISGSWKLVDAERQRAFSSESFMTGYESGLFTFYDNGTASYSDATGILNGSWDMRKTDGGYYDQDGNWHSDQRTDMLIKLYDFRSNRVLEWYFDYIDFRSSGNRLTGFMEGANYNYRYYFRKQ
jgi:hypothetical protein